MPGSIITLTSDFRLRDPYVAEMKAVILSISPSVAIVDITHEIEKFNVRMGAYILASASSYFPKGTIHVAVVDPGVGTKRRSVLMQISGSFYVGPDNGLLVLAAKNRSVEHIYEIANRKLMLPRVSSTFHGRDVFAPVAAHLANGMLPANFGPEVRNIVMPEFARIAERKDMLVGEVLHVDNFGNIITNFGEPELAQIRTKTAVKLKLKSVGLKLKLCRAYADVNPHEPLAIVGSHDFLEISINQGNAAEIFKIHDGDRVILYRS
jgi:hypothetical protein